MRVVCSICKKTYANKYSLAAHQRRYHKEDVELHQNEEHDALNQKGDNDVFSVVDQNSNDGAEVSECSEQMDDNDEEMHENEEESTNLSNEENEEEEEGEEKPSSEEEEGEESSNGDGEVEEHSSDDQSDGMSDSTQNNDRFSDSNSASHKKFWMPKRLVDIMKAIKKHLEDAQEVKNLQLLDSYELKNRFFNELSNFLTNRNINMEDVLTNKELMLTSAVLNTKDLFAVCKLLSENIDIICSIKNKIKQYENESESENSSGLDEEDATPKKAFYCLICDIPFSNAHSLTDHFGANHTGPNGVQLPNVEPLKLDKYCLENSSHSENSSCEEDEEINKSDNSNNGDSESETNQYPKKHRNYREKGYSRTDVTKIAKNPKLVRSIFRMVLNGEIPLDEKHIQKLQPHKHAIRKIASSTSSRNRRLLKKEIGNHVQTGGSMLGSVLKVVAPIFKILINLTNFN